MCKRRCSINKLIGLIQVPSSSSFTISDASRYQFIRRRGADQVIVTWQLCVGGRGVQVNIALVVLHKGDLFLQFPLAPGGGVVLCDVAQS